MRRLILIKHSLPLIEPGVPPEEWRLSEDGKRRAVSLARVLAAMKVGSLYSSDERKAIETATIISGRIGRPLNVDPGFKEHIRRDVPFLGNAEWRASVLNAINHPSDLVLGSETVEEAWRRFSNALASVEPVAPLGDMIVVSHGTVISMFVARLIGVDPAPIWDGLGLPGLVVVTWPAANQIEYQQNFDSNA